MVTRDRAFGDVSLSHAAAMLRGVLTGVLVVQLLLVHLLLLLLEHHLLLRSCLLLAVVSCLGSCRLNRRFVTEDRVVGVVGGVVGTPTPIRVVPSPN